uniref:Uncharacterized protein n=1 Tax=Romanomermis culicivorax TaxID=13658 RepID=A0A915J9U6_ROMCU
MTTGSRRGSNYPSSTPIPVRSLFKMEVKDHRGIGARQRVKNFYDQTLRIRDERKFGRRSSSMESNVGSNRSPTSDGGADDKGNTKRRIGSPSIDKKEMNFDKEMQELDRKVKHCIDSKYAAWQLFKARSSGTVIFLCGFYCKICQKMIPGNVDDIMAKHGSRESHMILTKPKVDDRGTQSGLQEQAEDDTFDIRFDDDGCLLILKLDDDVENHSNVDIPLSIINDCDSSTKIIDSEKISAGECIKNDIIHFTNDEDDEDEREEGETMDDDGDEEKHENNNEFEDISEDREKTPEPSRRRRRYDRTSSKSILVLIFE